MKVVKSRELVHFRIYVRDEKTRQTVSAGVYNHEETSKEEILDKIILCLNKS